MGLFWSTRLGWILTRNLFRLQLLRNERIGGAVALLFRASRKINSGFKNINHSLYSAESWEGGGGVESVTDEQMGK